MQGLLPARFVISVVQSPKKEVQFQTNSKLLAWRRARLASSVPQKKKKKKHNKIDFFNTHTHTKINKVHIHSSTYTVINSMLLKLFHMSKKNWVMYEADGRIKCARTHEGSGYKEVP